MDTLNTSLGIVIHLSHTSLRQLDKDNISLITDITYALIPHVSDGYYIGMMKTVVRIEKHYTLHGNHF